MSNSHDTYDTYNKHFLVYNGSMDIVPNSFKLYVVNPNVPLIRFDTLYEARLFEKRKYILRGTFRDFGHMIFAKDIDNCIVGISKANNAIFYYCERNRFGTIKYGDNVFIWAGLIGNNLIEERYFNTNGKTFYGRQSADHFSDPLIMLMRYLRRFDKDYDHKQISWPKIPSHICEPLKLVTRLWDTIIVTQN